MPVKMLLSLLKLIMVLAAIGVGLYAGLLAALTTQFVQTHAVYLHAFQMIGNKDLNVPGLFGFLRGEVTPFDIYSSDGTPLHAWHILPFGLYLRHLSTLKQQPVGLSPDVTDTLGFQLRRDNPEAVLAIHFHGAGGNIGSGYRISNYHALAAGSPERFHVLTFDYRGFGNTPGVPSDNGLIQDAIAVVDWATNVAKLPPSRILLFGQSLGTAVNMAVAEHFAMQHDPVIFAGHILIAPFVDLLTLATTYKIAGTIPVLSPIAQFPVLFNFSKTHIQETWSTKTRIAKYARRSEEILHKYHVVLIHAEDDYNVPWHHTPTLFSHVVNATSEDEVEPSRANSWRTNLGHDLKTAERVAQLRTDKGVVSVAVMEHGLHDVIMGSSVVSLFAVDIFAAGDGLNTAKYKN